MSPKEVVYSAFYLLSFVLAMSTGIQRGFTGTHTPPIPFAIELFTIPIGLMLLFIDFRMYKSARVHKIGLTANGLIMIFVVFRALSHI